jgi:outer membrane protein assembly factor BamB
MKTPVIAIFLALIFLLLASCTPGTARPESGWAGPVLSENRVYVSSQDGRVVALNAQSCAPVVGSFPQEQDDPNRLMGIYGTPSLEAGTLFVGSYDDGKGKSKLYALNASDLNSDPFWTYPGPGDDETDIRQVVAGSVVVDGKVIFGSSDGYMRAINIATGQLAWSPFKTNDKIWSTPTVDSDTVYFGSLDHGLYAISVVDGSPRWPSPFQAGGSIVSSPLVVGGRVYFGSFDRKVYAVDTRSGTQVWSFQGDAWFWSSPVVDIERRAIYIGDMNGMLYALDIDTGVQQWEFDLENPIISTPVMIDGLLVVASDGGLVYVISPAASIQQPPFIDVKAKVRAPLETKDGIVYIHALDHKLTALRVGRTIQDKLWEYDTETGECSR